MDIIEREIAAGLPFGPWHQQWLLARAPEKVRRYLQLAREHPGIMAAQQSFMAPINGLGGVPTADFGAINTSAAELNMIGATQANINQYAAIPPAECYPGKVFELQMFGVYGNTATPTMIFTPRWGSSPTPGTNITLGANAAWTSITGTTALPYFIQFMFVVRTAAPGATTSTGRGFGQVQLGIPLTSSQLVTNILIGGTAATIDTSGQGAAGCGLTMNLTWSASSASNTSTCAGFVIYGRS